MKPARLAVLAAALGAAGLAAMLMSQTPSPETVVVKENAAAAPTTEVLVAAQDLPVGTTVKPSDVRWQAWPADAVPPGTITKTAVAGANNEVAGSLVRTGFMNGDPIRTEKLVKANSNAFMSAILPSGMRAVAISIDGRGGSSAGGFVLPGDRVDIIKTFRDEEASKSGGSDVSVSETILSNIRVLAIGQNVQERSGEKVVSGDTATLEVTPSQAETLSLAQKTGQLSLALRSLADANEAERPREEKQDTGLTIVRYGRSAAARR